MQYRIVLFDIAFDKKRVYNKSNTSLWEDFKMEIKLCAFADEYSSALDRQIEALVKFKIPYIELRGVDGKNVTAWEVSDAENWKKKPSVPFWQTVIRESTEK